MPHVLIVDDEPAIVANLKRELEEDYPCLTAKDAAEARDQMANHRVACIISDQRMPGESGAELLAWVKIHFPDTQRILLTGYTDFDSAVAAINQGGISRFLNKPWEPAQLVAVVNEAVEFHRLVLENRDLQARLKARNRVLENENISLRSQARDELAPLQALVGLSPAMTRLKDKIRALLPSQSSVLITGESGTGKELVARSLHFGGSRRDKPFVALNCAALPESILESELFGHVKGAFTHAVDNRIGLLEAAQGGTLFLDEVGDMPPSMQAKVLRFLQEGVITPVGGRSERKLDVRIIAATHRDLETMVADKTFREDLYYRLNVIPLRTPALRERAEDIPLLAEHFVARLAPKIGVPPKSIDAAAAARLKNHAFPGNVRELENAIEYALNLVGDRASVGLEQLPEKLTLTGASDPVTERPGQASDPDLRPLPPDMPLDTAISALEKDWIQRALSECEGNITLTAKRLGLSRQGLHNKLAKYGLHPDG